MYKPNFTDPRIRNRATKALNFVELYISKNKTNWIAQTQLYEHFGNTSRPLGHYLKELLLITDDRYNMNTGQCKTYQRNITGVQELKLLLGITTEQPALPQKLMDQIATGEFEYEEKSNRTYNPIQCIPRDIRGPLLANHGYRYNYDIEAAAPTLLLQRAQQVNANFAAPALTNYINNRAQVRDQIALDCIIKPDDVKFVVNALLNGGVISQYRENKILIQLNYDYAAIRRLQHHDLMTGIRQDISAMWRILKPTFGVSRRLTGRDKAGLYRELESQCARVIKRALRKNKIRVFWEHDGWRSNQSVDTAQLVREVKRQTGFVIRLDEAVYE